MKYKILIDRNNFTNQLTFLSNLFRLCYDTDRDTSSLEEELQYYSQHKENIDYIYIENDICFIVENHDNDFEVVQIFPIKIEQVKFKKIEDKLVFPENIKILVDNNVISFYEIQNKS